MRAPSWLCSAPPVSPPFFCLCNTLILLLTGAVNVFQGELGLLEAWEAYRLAKADAAAKTAETPSAVSYVTIKAAVKALRFCVQYQHLTDELAFRNCAYNGEGSEIKYDQVLQGLINGACAHQQTYC